MSADERAVALTAPDLNGTLRTRHIPVSQFDPADTPRLVDIIFAFDATDQLIPRPAGFTGWWPCWDDGFGDLTTTADLSARRPIGWRAGCDVVFADLAHRDGTPVAVAPRQLLRRLVAEVAASGLSVQIGVEVEFFLADDPAVEARPEPDFVYAFAPPRRDHQAIDEIVAGLAASGIGVASWYTEGGHRQYEIALSPADPVTAADQTALTRCAVDEVTRRRGLRASFAPKPGPGFGSGLHAHLSVYDERGANLLRDVETEPRSHRGRQALAGVLAILKPATALCTPNPGGYHRLAPHTAAGTTATWAHDNRSAGVRYLDRGEQSRFEIRTAASDANPYLVLAALLAGVSHGVGRELPLPEPGAADIYSHAPADSTLPADLPAAVQALRDDPILNDHLGGEFVRHYAATRLWAANLTHRL